MRSHLLTVLAVALVAPCLSRGVDTTGKLRGVVRDPDGAIVVGAPILIQHWDLKD